MLWAVTERPTPDPGQYAPLPDNPVPADLIPVEDIGAYLRLLRERGIVRIRHTAFFRKSPG